MPEDPGFPRSDPRPAGLRAPVGRGFSGGSRMRIGAWQFDVRRGEIEANVEAILRGLDRARGAGVRFLAVPEMAVTSFMDPEREGVLARSAEAIEGLRIRSGELGIALCLTGFFDAGEERPRNRLWIFDGGEERLHYDKLHLFTPSAEPESFVAGEGAPGSVEIEGVRFGGITCYDLRFPEPARAVWRSGADVLVVPAQWPSPRAAHWELLGRARAVDGQCHVLACNRSGTDIVGRRRLELEFPGNSAIVNAEGEVLATGHGGEELVHAELDVESQRRFEVRVPLRKDDRPSVYHSWTSD